MSAPSSPIRVFVSSTWKDLAPEQRAVEKVLQRIRATRFVGMEHFGSRDEDARPVSLDEVDRCHVYVGIIGGRYGSGITEAEYRRARERNLPCFVYFKDEVAILLEERESDPEKTGRLAVFKEELRHNHTIAPPFSTPDGLAAGVAADLHNWLFDHYLPRLLSGISTDYAARVKNFLVEYLGTPERPVPFGGRDADFTLLNQWLDDPSSPPYLLLAAPAGRGKSALLTRWSTQLLARDDVAIVFFPVSVRFRTNLSSVVFAALATRLAALHGEKRGADPNTPAEVWRGVMTEYLTRSLPHGKSLIVILDGIDEAADWMAGPDLFSTSPPKGLRLVLSARYRAGDVDAAAWLRTVGWDRPDLALTPSLAPLTPNGIADILQRMGFPLDVLGKQVDIVAELHGLSEGDPLLVRLYVDDLWLRGEAAVRLSPEDLRAIQPGLEGYFSRWWEDQHTLWGDKVPLREPAVQSVLNLLSCALGPLDQAEILHLAPPEIHLSSWDLAEVLRDIQRFVIGDGRQQGYSFSHPRLRNYFYERLTKEERQYWEEQFFKWGEETVLVLNRNELLPKEVSSYIVQYYGGHLERAASDPAKVMSLASKGWKQAWKAVENSYAGFLNDVDRAWRAAEQADTAALHSGAPASNIAVTVRCALCHASVHSLAGNIPPALLEQLIAKNVWSASQGFTYACHLSNPKQQAEAISRLAPHLPESLLYEAVGIVRRISHLSSQTEALIALLPHLPEGSKADIAQIALKQISSLTNEYMQARGIITLTSSLPFPLLQEAWQTARNLKDPFSRSQALTEIALYSSGEWRGKVLHDALEAAEKIENDLESIEALTKLAPHFPEPLLRRAFRAALSINGYEATFADALETLAPYLAKSKPLLQGALKAARKIENRFERIDALSFLAPHLPSKLNEEVRHEIAQTISLIDDESVKAQPLIRLVACSSEKEQVAVYSQALNAIRMIPDPTRQAERLTELIPFLTGDLRGVTTYEAIQAIRESEIHRRTFLLSQLAPYLPELLLQDALDIAPTLPMTPENSSLGFRFSSRDDREFEFKQAGRDEALRDLAPYLKASHLREILPIIKSQKYEFLKTSFLAAIAPHLSDSLLPEALEITQDVYDHSTRMITAASLISHLPEEQQKQAPLSLQTVSYRLPSEPQDSLNSQLSEAIRDIVTREALRAALTMKDEVTQVKTLVEIVPHLPKEVQEETWRMTIRKAWTIHGKDRLPVLKVLFPCVSSDSLRNEILQTAQHVEDKAEQVDTLTALIPFLPEGQQEQIVHEIIQSIKSLDLHPFPIWREDIQARILIALAPYLSESKKEEALKISHLFESKFSKVATWAAFAPILSEKRKTEILQEALELARRIKFDSSRAAALTFLLPHLPEPDQSTVLNEALQASREIEPDFQRSTALTLLSPYLMRLSPVKLYPLWSQLLHFLARRTRSALVADLRTLCPVIEVLGGPHAIAETAREIYEIGDWW